MYNNDRYANAHCLVPSNNTSPESLVTTGKLSTHSQITFDNTAAPCPFPYLGRSERTLNILPPIISIKNVGAPIALNKCPFIKCKCLITSITLCV